MDVERTMEFILKSQAREARVDRSEARMDRTDKQIESDSEAHPPRHKNAGQGFRG